MFNLLQEFSGIASYEHQRIIESGELDAIFDYHYGNIVEELNLDQRALFILDNL